MTPADENRVGMEEKIAYLEKQVSDLDEVVRDLNGRVKTLERDLRTLHEQFHQHLANLHEPQMPGGEWEEPGLGGGEAP